MGLVCAMPSKEVRDTFKDVISSADIVELNRQIINAGIIDDDTIIKYIKNSIFLNTYIKDVDYTQENIEIILKNLFGPKGFKKLKPDTSGLNAFAINIESKSEKEVGKIIETLREGTDDSCGFENCTYDDEDNDDEENDNEKNDDEDKVDFKFRIFKSASGKELIISFPLIVDNNKEIDRLKSDEYNEYDENYEVNKLENYTIADNNKKLIEPSIKNTLKLLNSLKEALGDKRLQFFSADRRITSIEKDTNRDEKFIKKAYFTVGNFADHALRTLLPLAEEGELQDILDVKNNNLNKTAEIGEKIRKILFDSADEITFESKRKEIKFVLESNNDIIDNNTLYNIAINVQTIYEGLKNTHGDNAKFITDTDRIPAILKEVNKTVSGEPDLYVIDNEGHLYIYDFKTSISDLNDEKNTEKKENYFRQIVNYKKLLDSTNIFIDENGESIVHAGGIIYLQASYDSETTNEETEETEVTKITSLTPVDNYLIKISKNEDIFKDHPNFTFESLFATIEEQKKKKGITRNKKDEEGEDEEGINVPLESTPNNIMSATELTEHARNFAKNYSIFLDDIISGKRKIDFTAPDYEILNNLIENNKSNRKFLTTHLLDYYSNSVKNSLAYSSNEKSEYLYDNFDMFVKYAYPELIKLENISLSSENEVTTNTKNFDVSFEESEENGVLNRETSPIESWILSEMHTSSKNRISQLVKRRLSLLRNGDEIDDVLFINECVKDKIVIETLNHILVDCTTLTEMIEAIENLNEPWGEELLDLIKNDNVFASQFFTSFRNNALIFSTVIADKDENAVVHYRTHVINTDTEGTNFKNRLYNSFYSGNVGKIIKDGKYVEKVEKEIKENYDKILKKLNKNNSLEGNEIEEIIEQTTDILNKLGFLVDENTVKIIFSTTTDVEKHSFRQFKSFLTSVASTSSNSYLNRIKKRHEKHEKNEETDDFYTFCDYDTKEGVYQNIKTIIEKLLPGLQSSIESCCYENGKMYYTFQKPSKIHDTFKSILKGDYKLPETSLFSIVKPTWLKSLDDAQNSAVPTDLFKIHTQITNDHVNFKDLDIASLWISMLSEYDSNGRKDMGFYRIPNYSDKPVSEYIGSWKYSKEKAIEKLVDVAHQEVDRIIEVLNYAKTHDKGLPVKYIDVDKLSERSEKGVKILKEKLRNNESLTAEEWAILSENTGAEFKFLKHLNDEIKKETECGELLLKIINGEDRESREIRSKFIDLVGKAIEEDINKKAEEYYDRLENLDLLKIAEGKVNVDYKNNNSGKVFTYKLKIPIFKYLNNIVSYPNKTINKIINDLNEEGKEINTDNVKEKIEEYKEEYEEELKNKLITYLQDFAANDHLASINIIQLTYGDLAYSPNEVDFQKRFTAFHSPMQRVNLEAVDENGKPYSKDGNCRVLHIHADKIGTEISKNIAVLLDRKIEEAQGTEKKAYEALKKQILEFFDKFDSTDGQGYSTLTGLRKKLGMLGRWKKEDEDALNAIRNENFNVQTLAAAWQAMKPMIISQKQVKLDNGTTETMPYYVKDSEAILVFADALLGENKEKNPIRALMEAVEEFNAQKNNKGLGIDTIVFDSAVKLGNTKSLFINYSKNGYKFKLNDFRDSSPYVTKIPFSDWGLQQEVPNHFVDDEQAEGSQQRILGITDHNPNTDVRVGNKTIKAKKAIERVEKLEAQGIIESYEELAKRLGIKETNKAKRNKKLAKILQEEILKDSRFGMDLYRAVLLNENNDFTIPLGEAMHSTRIQQFINSIIKKHINKQYFKGGPAPQVAIMSDNLHIKFHDKEGNILLTLDEYFNENKKEKGYFSVKDEKCVEDYKEYLKDNQAGMAYWEVYTVCPDENLENLLREAGKQAGKDYMGNLDEAVKDGIIPESVTQLIGYRIPTEDKYSMAPMKIKGFLPRTSGEIIILPKEVVVITGSDFDIDKMFLMTKSFEYTKESEFEAKTKEGKKIKLNIKVKEVKEKDDFKNELFDLKWGLLTTEDNALKAFNPGNFEELKKQSLAISTYINMVKQEEVEYTFAELQNKSVSELQKLSEKYAPARDITYADTQVDFFDANMEGKKLVGIFANANTAHGFLSLLHMKGAGVHFNSDFKKFTLAGKTITGGTEIDPVMAFDDVTYVSKNLAKCLAAAVDVAKDNAVFGLNLNTFTASVACLLIRLGYDIKTVGLLLNQPAVKEVQKKFFNSKEYLTKETAINKVIQEYYKGRQDAEDSSQGLEEEEIEITEEDLLKGIRTGDLDNQIHVLNLFKRLMATATQLTELSNLTKFNSISNAPGPNISNNIALLRRVARFMNDENTIFDENAKRVFENSPILKAFYTTTLQDPSYYATESSKDSEEDLKYPKEGIATQIFKNYFPHYKERIKNIIDIIENNCKISLNAKDIDLIINQFILFSLTNKDKEFLSCINLKKAVLDFSKEERERLLTLPLALKKVFKENEGIKDENLVLKLAKIAKSTKQCNFPTVDFHAGNLDAEQQEDIKDAWTDLVQSSEEGKDLALFILKYEIFRSGFNFSPKTINHLVSVFTKYNFEGYIPAIRMLCEGDFLNDRNSEDLEQLFISQFYRNNSNKIKLVPIVTDNKNLGQEISTNKNNIQTGITFSYNLKRYYKPEFYIKTEYDIPEFSPYIKYEGKLYKIVESNVGDDTVEVEYKIVSPLGIANNFIEYDAQASDDNEEDNMKSIFIGKNIKDTNLKGEMNSIEKQGNDDDNGEEEDADGYESDQNVEDDDELSFTSVNLQKKSNNKLNKDNSVKEAASKLRNSEIEVSKKDEQNAKEINEKIC